MRKYFEHIKQKPTHERRTHAAQMAGSITAAVFFVWVATLGFRLATQTPEQAQSNINSSQLANVVSSQNGNATLFVASSTQY